MKEPSVNIADSESLEPAQPKWKWEWVKTTHNVRFRALLAIYGIFLGIVLGHTLKFSPFLGNAYWTERRIEYMKFLGHLLKDILQSVSLPILISGIVAAIGSMRLKTCRHIASRMFLYIFLSNLCAAAVGVSVTILIHPGSPNEHPVHVVCFEQRHDAEENPIPVCTKDGHPCQSKDYSPNVWGLQSEIGNRTLSRKGPFCLKTISHFGCGLLIDIIFDHLSSFFLDNILNAFLEVTRRSPNLESPDNQDDPKYKSCFEYQMSPEPKKPLAEFRVKKETRSRNNPNIRGLIVFFILFGVAGLTVEESGIHVFNIFTSLSTCTLKIGNWALWFSLFGMWSILAGEVLLHPLAFSLPATIWYYFFTCLFTVLLYACVILPIVYLAITRRSPLKFYLNILPVIGITFGTVSRGASVPITIEVLEEDCELDPRIVRLMIPIASQINNEGHAITCAVATMYIAQLHGVEYTFLSFWIVILTTFVAATFAPSDLGSFTEALTFRMVFTLNSLGLPSEFFLYVTPIEWMIHSGATMTSLVADCFGTAIVHHLTQDHFHMLELEKQIELSIKSQVSHSNQENWSAKNSAELQLFEKRRSYGYDKVLKKSLDTDEASKDLNVGKSTNTSPWQKDSDTKIDLDFLNKQITSASYSSVKLSSSSKGGERKLSRSRSRQKLKSPKVSSKNDHSTKRKMGSRSVSRLSSESEFKIGSGSRSKSMSRSLSLSSKSLSMLKSMSKSISRSRVNSKSKTGSRSQSLKNLPKIKSSKNNFERKRTNTPVYQSPKASGGNDPKNVIPRLKQSK